METRPAQFFAALDLFRRRDRASCATRTSERARRRQIRPEEIQRHGDLIRQSARKIRSRDDGTVIQKLQTPSTKLQISSKSQAPKACAHVQFGVWCLEFPWSLELGAWSFIASASSAPSIWRDDPD